MTVINGTRMPSLYGTAIEHDKRCALSKLLAEARAGRGWSLEQLSVEATEALRSESRRAGARATNEERELWASLEVSRDVIVALENHPKAPLGTPYKRARLLGVTLALGLDRTLVNRLAGGL